jgi:hypothetical protein
LLFHAPERTPTVPSGAKMDISEIFLHGYPLIEVYRIEGKLISPAKAFKRKKSRKIRFHSQLRLKDFWQIKTKP